MLSGSVWTADPEHGYQVPAQVRTGTIGVNRSFTIDFGAPFGGVEASGMGREHGPEGLGEYLEYQTIFTGSVVWPTDRLS
jgi:aldehyde dehydrogenase (NAD+)